jgi:hypothetical protein
MSKKAKAPELATAAEAKELLGLAAAEYGELVLDGSLRRIATCDGPRVLGADIDRVLQRRNRLVARLARFWRIRKTIGGTP